MDLTKVVLPTFILERRSLLEMYADFFAHPDLFCRWVGAGLYYFIYLFFGGGGCIQYAMLLCTKSPFFSIIYLFICLFVF